MGTPFPKGKSGNPGGMTKTQAAARELLNTWLCSDEVTEAGRVAYLALLKGGEPTIVKHFIDKVGGKEPISIEGTDGGGALVIKVVKLGGTGG